MSYQVIARKYRPQKFAEVIGQEHITKTLQNALSSKRIHHAYLFAGARGIGKTTVARILAKALNCEKGPTDEPCGVCAPCMEIAGGSSLDVQEIDGASNTGVDDVREIRERAKYMPAGNRYKIYIIDEVHMLSTAAFNALLKTLEEPPPHVVFIFATTESHKIPATILSRCQRYDFRRIPAVKIAKCLSGIASQEQVAVDEESLALISHEATGSLRDAQSLLDQAVAFAGKNVKASDIKSMLGFLDRKLTFDLLAAVLEKDAKRALEGLSEIFEMGADLTRFTMDFLACLRHMLVIKECGLEKNLLDLPGDETELLKQMADRSSAEQLQRMFEIWYLASDSVARSSFPKMLLEVMLMRLIRVEPVKPIAQLIEEIEALAQDGAAANNDATQDVIARSEATKQSHGIDTASLRPRNDESRESYDGFINWLKASRPQISAIFDHGVCRNITDQVIEISFDSVFYADMLSESDRKTQVEGLCREYFGRPMRIEIVRDEGTKPAAQSVNEGDGPAGGSSSESKTGRSPSKKQEQKKALTKEALETDIVREAANIFNARVHDVLTPSSKKE